MPGWRGEPQRGRQRNPDGDERDVADDELGREWQLGEPARVCPVEDEHASVVVEALVELSVADVDGDHAGGAALEQDIGEAAGRRAEVDCVKAARIDAERVEAVCELLAATRDVRRPALDGQLGVLVDLLAGLVVARDLPGHHERLRLRTRLRETAFDENDVEAFLHGEIPHVPSNVSPGSSRIRPSPVLNAFGGQVIGSTAKPRRLTSGKSPVKSCTYGHDLSAQTVTSPTENEPSNGRDWSSFSVPNRSSTSQAMYG
jgi:hypothetical protein